MLAGDVEPFIFLWSILDRAKEVALSIPKATTATVLPILLILFALSSRGALGDNHKI